MIKTLLTSVLGNKKGLLSFVTENTGKLSFRRIGSTMVIAWIVKKVEPADMTTAHAIVIGMCLISVALPKITELFTKKED